MHPPTGSHGTVAVQCGVRSEVVNFFMIKKVIFSTIMQNRQKVNFSTVNQQVPSIDKVNFLFLLFYSSHWFNVSHDIAIVKLSS